MAAKNLNSNSRHKNFPPKRGEPLSRKNFCIKFDKDKATFLLPKEAQPKVRQTHERAVGNNFAFSR